MTIKPLENKVAIKFVEEEKEEATKSGIVLPDTAKKDEKPQQGEVIAVGKGVEDVKVGDVVVFDRFAGTKVNLDKEEYVVIDLENLLAVIE